VAAAVAVASALMIAIVVGVVVFVARRQRHSDVASKLADREHEDAFSGTTVSFGLTMTTDMAWTASTCGGECNSLAPDDFL
jgi:glycerol uptake facilitator-like aquaporin